MDVLTVREIFRFVVDLRNSNLSKKKKEDMVTDMV